LKNSSPRLSISGPRGDYRMNDRTINGEGARLCCPADDPYRRNHDPYLVAIHHPDDYDASLEDEAMHRDIDVLNEEMKAAGVRIFVGGLRPASSAKSLRAQPDGKTLITDGPYLETKEHVGGFWVLEAADLNEALAWGRKAAVACRAPVEVRPFWPPEGPSK
jgi:hypothetical protein